MLLERLLAEAQSKARMHSAIEMLVLRALALYARGDLPVALDTLQRALLLAEPEGYMRIFLDEGAPVEFLLSEIGKADARLQGYVQRLLATSKVAPAHPPSRR